MLQTSLCSFWLHTVCLVSSFVWFNELLKNMEKFNSFKAIKFKRFWSFLLLCLSFFVVESLLDSFFKINKLKNIAHKEKKFFNFLCSENAFYQGNFSFWQGVYVSLLLSQHLTMFASEEGNKNNKNETHINAKSFLHEKVDDSNSIGKLKIRKSMTIFNFLYLMIFAVCCFLMKQDWGVWEK